MEDTSTYPTDIKLYEKLRIIGKGSFGQVWEAKIKKGLHKDEHVAIKEVDLEEMGDKNLDNLSQEITIMSSIQHENLLKTYTTCTIGHKIDIILPLMNMGSLNFLLNYKYPSGIKDPSIVATIIKSCLEGLICLNKNSLYHRDVKSANILLSSDGTVKLGDFGVATCIKSDAKKNSVVGSVNWMAPEVVKREPYDDKIDIWSLGITAIEIAQKNPPYFSHPTFDIMREIVLGDPVSQIKHPEKWHPSFIEFVSSCLVKDPKLRPNAEELLKLNPTFFSLARGKDYIKENLLKDIPTVQERFDRGITFVTSETEDNDLNENQINWNFEIDNNTNAKDERTNILGKMNSATNYKSNDKDDDLDTEENVGDVDSKTGSKNGQFTGGDKNDIGGIRINNYNNRVIARNSLHSKNESDISNAKNKTTELNKGNGETNYQIVNAYGQSDTSISDRHNGNPFSKIKQIEKKSSNVDKFKQMFSDSEA